MQEPVAFGDYMLLKRLAVSSMSEVFLALPAEEPQGKTPVVVKRLLPDVASVDTFVNLFHNEADIASSMDHPNVVDFLEFGELDGQLYLVMEYVNGLDLWRLSRRLGRASFRIPRTTAFHVTMQVLDALGYLHDLTGTDGKKLHIVHHDVSPSNILISRDGEVKLGDFGIAYSEQRELMTMGRKFKGKVHYLSPEQVRGDPVDHRSDLYSAGVVLVEMLLGARPFEGPTDLSVLINVRDRHSPRLSEALETMSPRMRELVERAIATDPSERYQDARAFRDAIARRLEDDESEVASRELAEVLASVMRSVDGMGGLEHVSSGGFDLKKTIDDTHAPGDEGKDSTPFLDMESRIDALAPEERTPATPVRDVSRYTVQKIGGEVLGALPLAQLIEGIVCGQIIEEDLVSQDGAEFQPIVNIPELSKHLPTVTPTERTHDLGLPDRRGMISEQSVVDVFLDMYREKESGLLIFECSSIRKDVFLEEGTPRYVSSNLASELLGEYLVRREIISRMELDMALAVLDRFEGHLGDTLLGLDILDSITLLRSITAQIKDRLYDIYGWETGDFTFYRNTDASPRGFRLSVPALELIKEGCLRGLEDRSMEEWFQDSRDQMLQLDPGAAIPLDDWKFSTSYSILLSELETPRSLAEIMQPYEHTSDEVREKLLRILRFGLVVDLVRKV